MPRGFSKEERERIESKLIEEGTKLFERFGLRKTSIDELVKVAGISKGSFYKFYPTKEALYFSCLERQELDLQEKYIAPIFSESSNASEMFSKLFRFICKIPDEYPLITITFRKEEYEELLRGVPEERVLAHRKGDQSEMAEFMETWRMFGIEVNEKPELLNGVFVAIALLNLHKKEIGEGIFDESMALLGKILGAGMEKLYHRGGSND